MTEVDATACADAYRALRERVSGLMRDADPAALDAIAPATPEWRVRDVLAHMVGVNTDIVTGTLDGVGTDPWTAVQVDTRRDVPIDEMLEEWETNRAGRGHRGVARSRGRPVAATTRARTSTTSGGPRHDPARTSRRP